MSVPASLQGVAALVASGASSVFLDSELFGPPALSSGSYDPVAGYEDAAAPVAVACRALVTNWSAYAIAAGAAMAGELKVLILRHGLSADVSSGHWELEVPGFRRLRIIHAASDPAQALWVCRASEAVV